MSKTIDELIPTDEVVIQLGAKTQRNEANGKDIVIDPQKLLAVPYAFYLEILKQEEEFDSETGYYRPFARTLALAGLPAYKTQVSSTGDTVPQLSVLAFETEADRRQARQQAAQAEALRLQQEAQDRARIEAETRAQYEATLRAEAEEKAAADAADREALKAQYRAEWEAELAQKQQQEAETVAAKQAANKAKADKVKADKEKAATVDAQ